MQVNTKSRTIAYSVLLFFSVSEVAFGVLDALFARGIIFGSLVSLVMAIISFVMIIWASILLGYNNKPSSAHKLTRVKAHALSLLVFAPLFYLLSVMLTVNAPFTCMSFGFGFSIVDPVPACAIGVIAAVQGWILAVLSTIMAVHLMDNSRLEGFEKNVTSLHTEDV